MARPQRTLSLCAALAAAVLCAPARAAEQGDLMLRAAMDADNHVSYTGSITSVVYASKNAAATVVRVDHRAPDSWRIWYVAPADAYGRLIVSNETTAYQYEPKVGRVYSNAWSESAPPVANDFDVDQVLRNYEPEVGAQTSVAGRNAHELSLTSKYSGSLVERLWVDDATRLVLRRERYHADGSLAFKSNFDNVRVVSDLPKELFDLSVPAGMTLVQGASYAHTTADLSRLFSAVSFAYVSPTELPEGFTFIKGDVEERGGVKTVQLIYSDGLRSFSLFQNKTGRLPTFDSPSHSIPIGSLTGQYAYSSGVTIVSWVQNGMNLTLVGDLAPRELARIGAALK